MEPQTRTAKLVGVQRPGWLTPSNAARALEDITLCGIRFKASETVTRGPASQTGSQVRRPPRGRSNTDFLRRFACESHDP
jgi:hypothetical protein